MFAYLEQHDPQLTPGEWAFVEQFFAHGCNSRRAYKTLHPAVSGPRLNSKPWEWRHKPRVAAEITFQIKARARKFEVTNDRITQELAFLAFNDPGEFYDDEGNLLSIHSIPEEARRALGKLDVEELFEMVDGERVYVGRLKKLGITDKVKALALLVKIQGMVTDKHEISASEDLALMLTHARKRVTREHVSDIDVEVLFA